MKRKILYLLLSWLLWLAVFAVGKVGFMLYNSGEHPFAAGDVLDVLLHGLSMDMSTAAYLAVVPWLLLTVGTPPKWGTAVRRMLVGYLYVAALLVAVVLSVDAFLYAFWKFKLDATVFGYMDDMQGTTNSVSLTFIATRLLVLILVAALIAAVQQAALRVAMPARLKQRADRRPWLTSLALLLMGAPLFLAIRGGVGTSVQNVGTAYYSQNLFLNHSAVNPAFSLFSSLRRTDDYARQFRFYDEATCAGIVRGLYPQATSSSPADSPSLLVEADGQPPRPNVLIVLMEGFGSRFVEALGGLPDVAPCFNKLVGEGVFFDNYYSNSFRTDRGTLSLFSGWVSYPTESLMKLPEKAGRLPGLARSLAEAGYTTEYVYGGDINFTGTRGYLVAGGFQRIVSDADFPIAEARSSKWGVADGIAAERVAKMLTPEPASAAGGKDRSPRLTVFQTLSSHEPFEVPYSRLADKTLNAFAYTDACVGQLVDKLKHSAVWSNLLVVLVPDHGFLLDGMTYEDPEFFHCPMLWLGGAVKQPRRIKTLMTQSDVAATLLGQLGLPHDNYPWSRDVFSPEYTYPYAYSTFPSGVMFTDKTGTVIYDINSERVVTDRPASGTKDAKATEERVRKAKALLQHSYSQLDALR